MDNSETESNCSYYSDGIQSNASSLSGLSLYGNEFAELRHLVNPNKYPQPYLERSSTPKPELIVEDDKLRQLKNELQQSLELNERYKLELHNLERKSELKYCDKVDKLLRSNSRLEGELKNANSQIERLLKNYKDKHDQVVFKEKLDLERKVYQINSNFSTLQRQYAKIQQDKIELELENKNLKITFGEFITERDIKNCSIESLKQKVSEQHIEIQNSLKKLNDCQEKVNQLTTNLTESDKSRLWYKEQLTMCQNDKAILQEKLFKCKNQLTDYNEKVSNLNISLSKYKNEVDNVRLQALKEKEELFKKLENINLDCNILNNVPATNNSTNNNHYDMQFYEHTMADLREEVLQIKATILQKDKEFEKLNHENSTAISKCLVLQQTLKQREADIETLESLKKDLFTKLEYLKENEKENLCDTLKLRNRLAELEIEVKMRNQEKRDVEGSIQLIRNQFLKFKQNYERVKNELNLKDKEILRLQKEKQELFMNNNWTICELEKLKQKDIIIGDLKKENETLIASIGTLKSKIRELEFQLLKGGQVIEEKEDSIKKLMNYKNTSEEYETLLSANREKICKLEGDFKEISDKYKELVNAYQDAQVDIEHKDLKLGEALKNLNQQQNALASYKNLQEKHNSEIQTKNQQILNLQNKLDKLENDWQNYLKRITDDQKIELLLNNHKKVTLNSTKTVENYVTNFFNHLNIEEFESSIDIRLKYLDERINKIRGKSEHLQEVFNNKYGPSKIKELEILLRVKERDMQEKRKKMDTNNRTLLRKVKEHMRGRNAAEKQLKYLQDLYNALADVHNTSELAVSSKEIEIKSLQGFCEAYQKEIEKLKKTVINLEQEISGSKVCEGCMGIETIKEKLDFFEAFCQDLQDRNKLLEGELNSSKEYGNSLYKKITDQENANKLLRQQVEEALMKKDELNTALFKLQGIEKQNESYKKLISNLESALDEKENALLKLSHDLTEAKERIDFLSNEIKISSSDLQQKAEYSQELEKKIVHIEKQCAQNNEKHESTAIAYKQRLLLMENEIRILKNDKFFFKRLSSDLKMALNSYTDHNKKLQEQINILNADKQPFMNWPTTLLEDVAFAGKYDEKHISRLLEENRAPSVGKPVTAEIQGCLNKLREEIYSLQDQITKKNMRTLIDMG